MSDLTVPEFETDRLFLRPIAIEHVKDYEKHFIDYEVIRNLSSAVPWPYPSDGIRSFVEQVILPAQGKDRWFWGIFLKENPHELIGGIDLWREGRPEHRGFWLGKKFWGRGYMTEAVVPVIDYAFSNLGFDHLIFSNAVGNLKSRRVKEKTGARLLGVRPAKFVDPALTEAETWELTKTAWEHFKLSR